MDRPIKKKKWTIKRIIGLTAIAVFAFFLIYLLFFRDKQSRLYVNKDQLSIFTSTGLYIPGTPYTSTRCREASWRKYMLRTAQF